MSSEKEIKKVEEVIEETIKSLNNLKVKPYLIGIAGGSASGKTSVAQVISKLMGIQDCILISQDSYYKVLGEEQYRNLSEYNFDHPNAFDFDLVVEHLNDLLSGKDVEMPVYNFTKSRRESFTHTVKPCHLIIFEGILALYDKRVRNLMDMRIFVDTDSDVRLARRGKYLSDFLNNFTFLYFYFYLIFIFWNINLVYRDIKERGRNLNNVLSRYHKFVKPAFDEYIRPTRKLADVIILRGAENTVAIDLVAQHLKYQLSKILQETNSIENSTSNPIVKRKSVSISQHDLIDPKYQFFEEKVVVSEEPAHVEVLQDIFQDFINGKNLSYYKLFLDHMVNTLISLYSRSKLTNPLNEDVIITELDDVKHIEKDFNKAKKIIYFQTSMLVEKDFNNLE